MLPLLSTVFYPHVSRAGGELLVADNPDRERIPGAVTHIPLGDLDPTGGEPPGAVLPRHPAPDQPVRRRALFRGR